MPARTRSRMSDTLASNRDRFSMSLLKNAINPKTAPAMAAMTTAANRPTTSIFASLVLKYRWANGVMKTTSW